MSAIYGIINMKSGPIQPNASAIFLEAYGKCKIDRHEQKSISNALFGCGIQYYTKESLKEQLPIVDKHNKIMFTADCLLDNRGYLLKELSINDQTLPDGSIIYQSYLKWGQDCVSHLRGVFSFVVYNWRTNNVYLFADHFANRCLYYHFRDGILYFSTLMFPMVKASGLKYKENKTWLINAVSSLSPVISSDTRKSAYEDVLKVDSGHYVHVNVDGAVYHTYWNPLKHAVVNKRISDEEARTLVINTLSQSVSSCIRTDGEVGVTLSCGLDSSTAACMAAPMLQEKGKRLFSYTSIPFYKDKLPQDKYYIDDESNGVFSIVKAYPNIIPKFLACAGMNAINQAHHTVDIWELPSKSQQNSVWTDEIYRVAEQDGCKILLTGSTGNCTISAGHFMDYLVNELRHLHIRKAYHDFISFTGKYGIRKKKMASITLKNIWNKRLNRFTHHKGAIYQYMLTKRELQKEIKTKYYPYIKSMKIMHREMYLSEAYSQICDITTKYSLAYGVLERDPMRNVDFIELCLRLPMRCYVNESYERRMVRDFMKGIVPDEILNDFLHRGRQGSDNLYRLTESWTELRVGLKALLSQDTLEKYLDTESTNSLLDSLNKDNLSEHEMEARVLVNAYIFGLYREQLNKYT